MHARKPHTHRRRRRLPAPPLAQHLMGLGADVFAESNAGHTACDYASMKGAYECAHVIAAEVRDIERKARALQHAKDVLFEAGESMDVKVMQQALDNAAQLGLPPDAPEAVAVRKELRKQKDEEKAALEEALGGQDQDRIADENPLG